MRAALALVALAACSSPAMPGVDATPPDASADAVAVDADGDAPDAPPTQCPTPDPPAVTDGSLPIGAWDGQWICVSDCTRPVALPLFTSTRVVATADRLAWRGIPAVQATAVRGCLVVVAADCVMRGYALCRSGNGAVVQFAAAYQSDVQRWQMWEFRGHVPM